MGKGEYVLPSGYELEGKSYRYRIERVLGQGSFGITYLATTRVTVDGSLGKLETRLRVAIKEFFMEDLNGRQGSTVTSSGQSNLYENYKRKFAREAESLSRLKHRHIVKVLELFERNNTFYYAMEYCEGGSLDEKIEQEGGLSERQAKEYLVQLGSALSYMHGERVLHLDLKPSNIMLRSTGEAVLIDFGLSKHYDEKGRPESSTTIGAGTPGYAAMEQSNYREGSGFAATLDVYGLGATLYKMLSGERPPLATDIFNEGFPREVLEKKGISKGLIAVVEKSMSSAKRDRYQSIREMMSGIDDEGTEIVQAGEDPSAEERTEVEVPPRVVSSSDRTSPGITSEEERKEEKGKGRGKKRYRWIVLGFVVLVWGGLELFQIPQGYGWVRSQRELAEQGHAEAQYWLGYCYYYGYYGGLIVSQDYAEAVKWYRQAAEQGRADAQYMLGDCYYYGSGVSQDYAEAVKWYRKAAEQGYGPAKDRLATMDTVAFADEGRPAPSASAGGSAQGSKPEQAAPASSASAGGSAQGSKPEQATPASSASAGKNTAEEYNKKGMVAYIQKNYTEAVKWFRKAAEQGYAYAQKMLGLCYYYGQGVSQDYAEAVKWYRKAAEQGYADAQNTLGVCYYYGQGVSQDYAEAVKWYRKAAEQGNAEAQYRLGVCYYNGLGVDQDDAEAVKWYRKAAEQGEPAAEVALEKLGESY